VQRRLREKGPVLETGSFGEVGLSFVVTPVKLLSSHACARDMRAWWVIGPYGWHWQLATSIEEEFLHMLEPSRLDYIKSSLQVSWTPTACS
jgi:hypothetical protein